MLDSREYFQTRGFPSLSHDGFGSDEVIKLPTGQIIPYQELGTNILRCFFMNATSLKRG